MTAYNSGLLSVKYNSSGIAQSAIYIVTTTGVNSSVYYTVAVDSAGNVYAAGYFTGGFSATPTATLTDGVTFSG